MALFEWIGLVFLIKEKNMQSLKDKFSILSKKVYKYKLTNSQGRYFFIETIVMSGSLFSFTIYKYFTSDLYEFFTCVVAGVLGYVIGYFEPIRIYKKIYYTIRKKNAVNKGIIEADQSNLELSNRNSKSLQKSYFENLPFWACKLPEDYRANLIDLRKAWFEGKPLNLCTHLQVKLLTLQFLLQDVLWSHISYRLQKVFRPVRRPRL